MRCRALILVSCGLVGSACSGSNNNSTGPNQEVIALTGTATVTAIGQTSQLAATGTQGTGSPQNITNQATWTSSNMAVATVSSSGLVTATGFGSTTITAAFNGANQTLSFAVSLNGNWSFTLPTDNSEVATWTLTETGGNVTGPVGFNPPPPNTTTLSTNAVSGTIAGSALTWTWTITASADPNAACIGVPVTFSGTAQIAASGTSMTATITALSAPCDKSQKVFNAVGQIVTLTKG